MPVKERRTDVSIVKRLAVLEEGHAVLIFKVDQNTIITNKALQTATNIEENTATLIELAKWVVTTRKVVLWMGALIITIGSVILVLKSWWK